MPAQLEWQHVNPVHLVLIASMTLVHVYFCCPVDVYFQYSHATYSNIPTVPPPPLPPSLPPSLLPPYLSETGSVNCTLCARGHYANRNGSASCELCRAGTHASTTGIATCQPCSPGSYSKYDSSTCIFLLSCRCVFSV